MIFFIIAIVLGIAFGLIIPYNLTSATLPYVAVAIVAALDSVFGGIVAYFNKKFNMNIFITGLFSNALLAVIMTWVGDLLGITLYFATIVVFGVRIFNNMANIRRTTADIYFVKRYRRKERERYMAIAERAGVYGEDDEDENEDDTKTNNKETENDNSTDEKGVKDEKQDDFISK